MPENKNEHCTQKGVRILGYGSYMPPLEVTNEDFEKIVDTTDEWIVTRTGIKSRRFNTGKPNYFMAAEAAKAALKDADVNAEDVDMILVSSCSPDYFYPAMSCLVQNQIGAKNAACADVSSACTGFITALDIARTYLALGNYKKILVIASEMMTNQMDFDDRASCVLFGDGAAAVLVEAGDKIYGSYMCAAGENPDAISLYCGSPTTEDKSPFTDAVPFQAKNKFVMDGKTVYKFAVDVMPKAAEEACRRAGFEVKDLDWIIPHQANIRIIKSATKAMNIDESKVYSNIDRRGNVSSACIPTCLDELYKAGKLKEGMKICLVGFGGGLTYGACALEL
jgi:3-oxoacyl-[acyl-carrier-protein] synthase-3